MSSAQVAAHPLGDHLRLLDDLLDRQLADDAAQVPFHHQPDQALALLGRLGQELLGRGLDRLHVRLDLDLRDRLDRHRDALLGVEVLHRRDVERHQLERQLVARLDHRKDDRAVPLHDPRAAEAVDDQRLVRTGLPVQRREERSQQRHRQHHQTDDHPEPDAHATEAPFTSSCATSVPPSDAETRSSAAPRRCRAHIRSPRLRRPFSIACPSALRAPHDLRAPPCE